MKLKELLYNIIDINCDIEILGVSCDLKKIKKDHLFICLSERFIDYKVFSNAAAVIANIPGLDSIIFHSSPRLIYHEIVSRFYKFQQPEYAVAVTGTNGKTSVVEFCRQIWQYAGYKSASIGTLGLCINNHREENKYNLTTPNKNDLYEMLRNRNIEHIALEASSHGIDQYRMHGLKLRSAAFTNFSSDHLDYHISIDEYFETKKKLFSEVLPQGSRVILNADVKEYITLLNIAREQNSQIITYGKKGAHITLLKQVPSKKGQYLIIKVYDKVYNVFFRVFGKFQVYNLLCAIGMSELKDICIEKLQSPEGRMERISDFVFVDYAHTPDALKQALLSLKWHFKKKVVLVFGCGGNRDKTKRFEMSKVANRFAERVIITDDNPRNEDPAKIRYDLLQFCPNATEIGDRKMAIEEGINTACNKGMILLIAGKGHEKYQILQNQVIEFSDKLIIKKKLGES